MIAWSFVVLGALLWLSVIWFWLRRPQWLRWWLGLLIPVWCLSPAPVEGSPGDVAPAIIAACYELLIQSDGNPGSAIAVLVIGTLLLTLGVAVAHVLTRFMVRRGVTFETFARRLRRNG